MAFFLTSDYANENRLDCDEKMVAPDIVWLWSVSDPVGTGRCSDIDLYGLGKTWQLRLRPIWAAFRLFFVTFLLIFSVYPMATMASGQSRRVVVDTNSGYALFGYDPVAYFTRHVAVPGLRENEFVWQGVSWIFASKANRAVFMDDPEIYAPQYGGHGALAMARGYPADCNPNVWAIYGDRLFLFYSYTARAAWAEAVDLHVERADKYWVEVEGTLSR